MTPQTPTHVAIIMDGNGRWAESRHLGRTRGHREGAKRVDEIVTACRKRGVKFLTLYAFSTENWNRPAHEVSVLWRLLVQHLKTMDKKLRNNDVALTVQGTIERLPIFVKQELDRVIKFTTTGNEQMILNLCLSYGGRQEIVDAVKKIIARQNEVSIDSLTESTFRNFLYHPEIPDPDLLIRTGGDLRISNFLLWQIAYSEIYVTETLWPDFKESDLDIALNHFGVRERRFGLTSAQIINKKTYFNNETPQL